MQQTARSTVRAPKAAPVSKAWRRLDGSWNVAQISEDLAVMLVIVCGATPFFIINGHWSVTGLELFLRSLGESGRIAWVLLSAWRLGGSPVLPWALVFGISAVQIVAAWRRKNGDNVSWRLIVTVIAVSVYDLATTFFGAGTVAWIARYGVAPQVLAALVVTFLFELAVGALLGILSGAWRGEE